MGDKHLTKLKDATQRKARVIQNPDLPRNRVDVKACRTRLGEDYLEVKVFSTHGDGWLAAKLVIRPSKFKTASELVYAIEAAGGAGAEHLAEAYGDDLDPEKCAKYAKELGLDALAKVAESYQQPKGHHDNKIIITP